MSESSRKSACVLLVDDDESNRMTLGALLEEEGYQVTEAASLAEGLGRLKEGLRYQAILLDWNLGDGHGSELLEPCRQHQPQARIIVVSGDQLDPATVSRVAGVHEKMADFEELLRKIEPAGA
jgi:CheY-like chemotaxis protein